MSERIKDALLLIAGNFFIAAGVRFFIIPYSILSGGVAGISVALFPLLHISEEMMITILTYGLFIAGTVILGKDFFFKTLLSTLVYPPMIHLLNLVTFSVEVDPILASVYSGILAGIGVGLAFRADASTGGMDIPPLILHKLTGIQLSTLVMITDALTVLLGTMTYGISAVLLGLVSVYVGGITIDKVVTFGSMKAKQVMIISEKSDLISEQVLSVMGRGLTFLEGKGGFTGAHKNVLMVVVSGREYQNLVSFIEKCDPDAFVICNDTNEIRGEGFTYFRI